MNSNIFSTLHDRYIRLCEVNNIDTTKNKIICDFQNIVPDIIFIKIFTTASDFSLCKRRTLFSLSKSLILFSNRLSCSEYLTSSNCLSDV